MAADLKQCQYEVLARYLKSGKAYPCWELINRCFKNIFPQPVFDLVGLVKEMGSQGNYYYCYLNLWLKSQCDMHIDSGCSNSLLYRGVWCTVTPGDLCEVLVKGHLWQNDITASVCQSMIYSPDIDFVDDGNQSYMFLTAEQRCGCLMQSPLNLDTTTQQTTGLGELESAFQRLSMEDTGLIIQLPWKVTCKEGTKMHAYHVIKEDIWLYSTSSDSRVAYQQYLHP